MAGQQIFCGEIPEAPRNCSDTRRHIEPDALRSLSLTVNVCPIDPRANLSLDFAGTSASPMFVHIGYQIPSLAYTGLIDDVLIYNRALSAAEVAHLYDGAP